MTARLIVAAFLASVLILFAASRTGGDKQLGPFPHGDGDRVSVVAPRAAP